MFGCVVLSNNNFAFVIILVKKQTKKVFYDTAQTWVPSRIYEFIRAITPGNPIPACGHLSFKAVATLISRRFSGHRIDIIKLLNTYSFSHV